MKFYITEEEDYEGYADGMDTVELNTLDELRAFALGARGSIKIDFAAHDRDGEAIRCPVIRKPGSREELDGTAWEALAAADAIGEANIGGESRSLKQRGEK